MTFGFVFNNACLFTCVFSDYRQQAGILHRTVSVYEDNEKCSTQARARGYIPRWSQLGWNESWYRQTLLPEAVGIHKEVLAHLLMKILLAGVASSPMKTVGRWNLTYYGFSVVSITKLKPHCVALCCFI